jgi:hypothetical protein
MMAARALAYLRATVRITSALDAADRLHGFRRELLQMDFELLEAVGVGLDILGVVEVLGDDDVHHRIEQGHVAAGLEAQHVAGEVLQRLAARVHHDEVGAALGGLLEIGGRDGMVLGRVGADDDDDVGILDRGERRGDGARADGLHQRGDGRGMAQPGAVVDIVAVEAGAHELLEQIGLLVGALGRAEAGEAAPAMGVADGLEALAGEIEGFLPARLAEVGERVGRVDVQALGLVRQPDQRLGQAFRVDT